jgi:outer membrane cobalamin receptor
MMIPHAVGVAPGVARGAIRLAALAAIVVGGCHVPPRATSSAPLSFGRETLITEEDIARMSVRTAWDVVRMRSPRFSAGTDSTSGRASRVRIQEPRSVNADETPLLVVDGMQSGDISYLSQIPASDVHAIHILDAEAAEPLYGLRAAGGAIVVETKRGR